MAEDMDLFNGQFPDKEPFAKKHQPLADRFRPQTLEEFVGQEHLVGEGGFLREAIRNDQISIFFSNIQNSILGYNIFKSFIIHFFKEIGSFHRINF